MKDKILLGDCLELLKDIPDGSVDCVICDLPFGTTACKWDVVIPFEPLWEQYNRITKENAAILLFGVNPFLCDVINSNRENFRYEIVWKKTLPVGFFNARRCPLRSHENIAVFYRKLPTYNPQMRISDKPKRCTTIASKTNGVYGEINKKENWKDNGMRFPIDVVEFKRDVKGYGNERTLHPTQKPVDLIAYLIRTYSNEGDIILDNTCGSGTTAIAAIREKRHFICMEKDEHYYQIACERVKKELMQPMIDFDD